MIKLTNEYGRKVIFINAFKNNYSLSLGDKQFLPDSQHTNYAQNEYKLYVTNKVTKAEVNTTLRYEKSTTRGVYFSFDMGRFGLQILEVGTYNYSIKAMSEDGLNDTIFELDNGLFHIYNKDTFTEPYIKPDVEVIPATKVYKPTTNE